MNLHFRLHNTGKSLVIESYPADNKGVDINLRKSWRLDSLGLETKEVPDKMNVQHGEYKVHSRKSLVRGGFRIEIKYPKDRIIVYPKNKNRNILKSKRVVYRFRDIGVESKDQTRDKKLTATLDPLPIDKQNKFKDLDF